jgi:hypothetical protein
MAAAAAANAQIPRTTRPASSMRLAIVAPSVE